MMRTLTIVWLILLLWCATSAAFAQNQNLKLWYDKPAEKWTDALPIGNGKLGAMIYGGVNTDHIQFNEQTLWTGGPRKHQREGAARYLPLIRQLLFEGKQAEAETLAEKHFMGRKNNEDAYPAQYAAWLKKITKDISFASTSLNDAFWSQMNLPTPNGWEANDLPGVDGAVWFRNIFDLPKDWVGKTLIINLGKIRDQDITYINGIKVGATDSMNLGRKYKIDPDIVKAGKNQIAVQVINPNDKGGFTGAKADQKPFVIYPEGGDPKQGITLSANWKYRVQDDSPPAFPTFEADYQPFGDLYLNFSQSDKVINYQRELDISKAISTTSYICNGIKFTREYFASVPQQAIVIHVKADKPGQVSFQALLQTLHKQYTIRQVDKHTLALTLKVTNGALSGTCYLYVNAVKGQIKANSKSICISQADEATLYLTAATNFKSYKDVSDSADVFCKKVFSKLKDKTYAAIKASHIYEYQRYFNALSIDLGSSNPQNMPTDERIRQFATTFDPGLLSLYMQYGRYLLISSSRSNSVLPANLQGIWNDQLTPPWGSKFTTNINLEMNYWPAEVLNLSECSKPLFNMIRGLAVEGKRTAKINYNAPGWVLHHNTDIWLGTAPINASNHGIWVSGGAWLCHQLWEHYLFTQDRVFLHQAYPQMKSAALFFVKFLVKDPKTGWLISTPSNSPEHGGLVAGPTMDHQIIRDLFKNCIAASQILNRDEQFRKILQEKYKQIAPDQIGKYGQLQEWLEDKDDTADTHRHVSHLWGVFPGTDIAWDDNPKLMHAAEKSFYYRGDDGTGWSLAWKVNLMARFKQGDHALSLVCKLLSVAENGSAKERGGVYHNLFDAHPPFQIDGNFGGAAGIAEMLLQSHQGYIELLPALPSALPNGEVKGICARGGFVLNIKWQNGKLQQVEVTSRTGENCRLKYNGTENRFKTSKGKTYIFDGQLKQL